MKRSVLEKVAEYLALNLHDINEFVQCLGVEDVDLEETTLRENNAPQFTTLIKMIWNPYRVNHSKQVLFDACKKCRIGSMYLDFLQSTEDLKTLIPKNMSLSNLTWLSEPHLLNSWLFAIANTFWIHFDLVTTLSIHFEENHSFVVKYKQSYQDKFIHERKQKCIALLYELLRSASIKLTCSHFWLRLCIAFQTTNSYLYVELEDLAKDNAFLNKLRFKS